MTAAAGAARSATALTDHGVAHATAWGLLLVVLGGLVEGTALGLAPGPGSRRTPRPDRPPPLGGRHGPGRRPRLGGRVRAGSVWPVTTVGATSRHSCSCSSARPLLGAVMGALLGAAQAWALRHRVRHPWRWVAGSAAGWTVAMPVIFLGATGVGATWPWWLVVPVGTADRAGRRAWHSDRSADRSSTRSTAPPGTTGSSSGSCPPASPAPRPTPRRRSGRDSAVTAPAPAGTTASRSRPRGGDPDRLVVLPGHPERKTWWRNLDGRPAVEVLLVGDWVPATGSVVRVDDPGWSAARAAYAARFPSVRATGRPARRAHPRSGPQSRRDSRHGGRRHPGAESRPVRLTLLPVGHAETLGRPG